MCLKHKSVLDGFSKYLTLVFCFVFLEKQGVTFKKKKLKWDMILEEKSLKKGKRAFFWQN